MDDQIVSIAPLAGWKVASATAVEVLRGASEVEGHLLARVDRLVLQKVEEDKPLTLVVTPAQPCQLARLSVTLNARFMELYSEDVYDRTLRGKTAGSKQIFEIAEEFAPPVAISPASRMMCKVASIKGDPSCVTLENLSFEFVGLRVASKSPKPASESDGGMLSNPLQLPMISAAVETIKMELRSSILEDLRIIAESQSMMMMSKLSSIEQRLQALETRMCHLSSAPAAEAHPEQQHLESETEDETKS